MCGIFGAIGTKVNPGVIRALAIANRERGTDSLGFFTSTGKMCKAAGDPLRVLGNADCAAFIDKSCGKGWFVAGHTRAATHGGITNRNAHPFRFGRTIGIHNGVVQYPKDRKYQVDSEYLIDQLNRYAGDYQAALGDVSGYWGLAWFDGSDFYLQAHKNSITMGCDAKGVWYFSSDSEHLDACVRLTREVVQIDNGDTVRFTVKSSKPEWLTPFVSTAPAFDYSAFYAKTNGCAATSGVWVPAKGKKGKRGKSATAHQSDDAAYADYLKKHAPDGWDDPFHRENDTKNAWLNDWDEYTKEYK